MKLIIDIPEEDYEWIQTHQSVTDYQTTLMLYKSVINGTPLDDVMATIEKLTIKERSTGFEFIMIDVLRHVLADIGKAESEEE